MRRWFVSFGYVGAVAVTGGCGRAQDPGHAPDATTSTGSASASHTPSDTSPDRGPSPRPSLSSAPSPTGCAAVGSFEIDRLRVDPACSLANDEPRVKAVAERGPDKNAPLRFEVKPENVRVTSGATFALDLTITNTAAAPVELTFVLRPDAWGSVAVRDPKNRDAWLPLLPGGPSSDAGLASARWVALRIAPRAVGHTRVYARAVTTRTEHLAPPPGSPNGAPYRTVEDDLAAGTYEVRIVDPILGRAFVPHVSLSVDERSR